MLVYVVSDEDIKDPKTGESLGFLELVRGTGKIIHLQDKISTLESDKTQNLTIRKEYSRLRRYYNFFPETDEVIESQEIVPLNNPQVGDQVKPI